MAFPQTRLRRLRETSAARRLLAQPDLPAATRSSLEQMVESLDKPAPAPPPAPPTPTKRRK